MYYFQAPPCTLLLQPAQSESLPICELQRSFEQYLHLVVASLEQLLLPHPVYPLQRTIITV